MAGAPETGRWRKLGVVAGGGALPGRVAAAARGRKEDVFVIRLKGFADDHVADFPGADCGLAEAGKLISLLKDAGCDAVVLAGRVSRPDFAALAPDWRGAALLPKAVAAAAKGDGALLSLLVDTLEGEGFRVVGAEEAAGDLRAGAGALTVAAPGPHDLDDIAKAAALVAALGPFDVGQGAVVSAGRILAVEAVEGTDAMLARCAGFADADRGGAGRRGVLVKRPKPGQELRVDLPTLGVRTIEGAAAAGLAGVAFEAGAALIVDVAASVRAADAHGLFLYGFSPDAPRRA
ncbi:MAG: UDP-2,3-diacylglucosamine diphosphatase LpxI [Pseudomonadota bacterium]